jgi:hypothetical protein
MLGENSGDAQQRVEMAGRSYGCDQYLHAGRNTGTSGLFQVVPFFFLVAGVARLTGRFIRLHPRNSCCTNSGVMPQKTTLASCWNRSFLRVFRRRSVFMKRLSLTPVENDTSAGVVHTSSSIDTDFIRPLGIVERFLSLLDQTQPTHFSVAAEIEGPTTLTSWRSALDAVQRRHPFFSVCIDDDDDSHLYFRRITGAQIPLRVIHAGNAEFPWEREIERELSTRFDPRQGPLIRVVLLYQPDKSLLILTTYHAIGDGMSTAFAIRDMLRALSGERLEPLSPLPSMEDLLGMKQTTPVRPISKTPFSTRPERVAATILEARDASPHVKKLRLSTELSSTLLDRSRQEKTTIHGALCAALVLAGRQVFSTWDNPVRIHSPVDLRRLLQLGDDYMQLASGGIAAVNPYMISGFWDIARFMKSGLAPAQSLDGVIAGVGGLNDLLLQGLDSQTLSRLARESHAHEATLTNLGKLPFDTSFGDLKLTSIWGPAINLDAENGQTVGAATVNGSVSLLYTSSTPAPFLLEVMEQLMVAACTHAEKA